MELRMTRDQREELNLCLPLGRVSFDEPMSRHSTMGVGGPAEAFVCVEDVDELKRVIGWASEHRIDYRFWGGGSNTLVRDGGLRGITIKLGRCFDGALAEMSNGDDVFVRVGAGQATKGFVRWAIDEGLLGLHILAGVWGSVGGNLITNAGTRLGSIGDVVEEITLVDRGCRELTLKRKALRFEYRSLKLPRTQAVTSCLLRLRRSTKEEVGAMIGEILRQREASQPVGVKSLGCIFKNPGKVSAGLLIEDAGLKGVRVGGARVSPKHANFIINENNATARDITVLMGLIRERVKEQSSITLETEISVVGEEKRISR